MEHRNTFVRIFGLMLLTISVSACSGLVAPTAFAPQTPPPTPTPLIIPLEATLTPFPPAVTLTLPPPPPPMPVTDTPTPTNTSLPPLPDFGDILAFGIGGGGGGACMAPIYPPPVAYVMRSGYGAHVAGLCVYQIALPVNQPIHLTLTSPDGTIALQGDFQSPDESTVYWLGFENSENNIAYYASSCKEGSCANWGVEFWWPANLPDGIWQVRLSWNGGEVSGIFDTALEATLPEFSVQDALVFSTLRPAESLKVCHPVASSSGLTVAGRGFPPNAVVYVPIYEQVEGTQYRFLDAQILVADAAGSVYGSLTGPFQSGKKYAVAAVTDGTLPLIAPDPYGIVGFGLLEDAVDCFLAP